MADTAGNAASAVFDTPELLDMILLEVILLETIEKLGMQGCCGFTRSNILGWLHHRLPPRPLLQIGSEVRQLLVTRPLSGIRPREDTADGSGLVQKILGDQLQESAPRYVFYNVYDSMVSNNNDIFSNPYIEIFSGHEHQAMQKAALEISWMKATGQSEDMPDFLLGTFKGQNILMGGFYTHTIVEEAQKRRSKLRSYLRLVEDAVNSIDLTPHIIVVYEIDHEPPFLSGYSESREGQEAFTQLRKRACEVFELAGVAHDIVALGSCDADADDAQTAVLELELPHPIDDDKLDFLGYMINLGSEHLTCRITVDCPPGHTSLEDVQQGGLRTRLFGIRHMMMALRFLKNWFCKA